MRTEYAVRFEDQSQPDMSGKKHYTFVGHTFDPEKVNQSWITMRKRHPDAKIVWREISDWQEE